MNETERFARLAEAPLGDQSDPTAIGQETSSDGEVRIEGRLRRLQVVERSLEEAKHALGEAEAALHSVYSGLALEPMPMAVGAGFAVAEPQPVAVASAMFDPSDIYRGLPLSGVTPLVQAIALIMVGAVIAFLIKPLLGPELSRGISAALRAPIELAILGGTRSADSTGSGLPERAIQTQEPAARVSADDPVVVIYERTSPYPRFYPSVPDKERHCLAEAIYYEARGEPVAGQIAVAQVVLNRTLAGSWPKTVCAVTGQGAENGEKCQFSYACQRSMLTKPFGEAWANAQGLAEEILAGGAWLEEMLDATHFHRRDLKPVWRLGLVEAGTFGRHIFYNSPTENRRPLSMVARR